MKLNFKFVWERFSTAIKIGRIPLFDVRRSLAYALRIDGFGHAQRRRLRRVLGILIWNLPALLNKALRYAIPASRVAVIA